MPWGKKRPPENRQPKGKDRCRECGKVLHDNGLDYDTFRGECLKCANKKARKNGRKNRGPI